MERHDLLHEFPEYQEKIHYLKTNDAHFRNLFDKYHQLEHQIHRINIGEEIMIDEKVHQLKTTLLHLKDDIYQFLIK